VKAPVLRGAELGRLEMSGQGVPSMSIPLYAGMDVPMLGFLPRILGGVRTLVLGS
jgi:D-alanyl-D-alanine carboxypeptidase (penicillin-binding protein 5/6)